MPTPAQLEALATARAAKAAKKDEPNVPMFNSSDVEALIIQLAEEKSKRQEAEAGLVSAEAKIKKALGVTHGAPLPEVADPYVLDEDIHIAGLNETTDAQTIADAQRNGKRGYGRVTHRLSNDRVAGRASTYWMYDEGGFARKVQRQSLSSAYASRLTTTCPICKGFHKESENNPNMCPLKPKVKRTMCDICKAHGFVRYIYDTQVAAPLDEDGNEIKIEGEDDDDTLVVVAVPSDAATRLKVRLEEHIRAFHVATAASMKL